MQRHRGGRHKGHVLLSALVLASLLFGLIAAPVAAERERSWVLDKDGQPLTAPVAYVFDSEIDGLYKESGTFRNPSDLFIDHEENVWIADSGNNRLVKFTKDGTFLGEYGTDPGPSKLNAPEGVFITLDGNIWVADRGNSRVVVLDPDGKFIRDFPKPSSKLLASDQVYQPSKIVVDRRGQLYVLNGGGDYRGMFLLDGQGIFRGFFAANRLPFNIIRAHHSVGDDRGPEAPDLEDSAHSPREHAPRRTRLHLGGVAVRHRRADQEAECRRDQRLQAGLLFR